MKIRKKLIAMMCVCALAVAGSSMLCYATSAGISATVTKGSVKGTYDCGKYGGTVSIRVHWWEKHKTTHQDYSDWTGRSASGNTTSVSVSRNSDEGYEYTRADFYGFYNGVQQATLENVTP